MEVSDMQKLILYAIYILMVSIGLVAMYSILNAGNPDSLLRSAFPDPAIDVYIAGISSFIVFVLGFVVFFTRDQEGFRNLIELNRNQIRSLRNKGKSDEEIADSILAAMGSRSGYKHNLAQKKLIIHLSKFK